MRLRAEGALMRLRAEGALMRLRAEGALMRLGVAALLALLLAGCATDPAARLQATALAQGEPDTRCVTTRLAALPLTFQSGVPVIEMLVDDRAGRFVVDTGADRTSVTVAGQRRLALQNDPAGRTHVSTGVAGTSNHVDATVGTLHFGQFRAAVGTRSIPVIEGLAAPGIDGVLGMDILGAFDVLLDLPRGRIVLYAPRPCRTPPAQLAATTLPPVPPEIRAKRTAFLVVVDGVAQRTILDTGSTLSFLTRDAATRLGVTDADLAAGRLPAEHVQAIGNGEARVSLHRFGSIAIGRLLQPGPILEVGDIPPSMVLEIAPGSVRAMPRQTDLLIGDDYLRTHRVWLSVPAERVHVIEGLRPGRGPYTAFVDIAQ